MLRRAPPDVTRKSRTPRTPSASQPKTRTYMTAPDWRDAPGRLGLLMPRRAEGRAQDEDRSVFWPVKAVLQGFCRRLSHPSKLPSLTDSPRTPICCGCGGAAVLVPGEVNARAEPVPGLADQTADGAADLPG
ncbi:hypothetical protein GCM10010329_84240 [Streptomyces spiroverticillatus]|uniref:Uncharacterized protein n=1 Tax=Streptomyces finlayi TaxID=67296 RepID=A0A918X5E4_9ACTN|nr:hypothetical protein GCM10010329_84240 [Streptomyces spiroverticillatus]GHD13692.1 hypothetical protein GCM10010334_72130 [Streptomyces finlayi]